MAGGGQVLRAEEDVIVDRQDLLEGRYGYGCGLCVLRGLAMWR